MKIKVLVLVTSIAVMSIVSTEVYSRSCRDTKVIRQFDKQFYQKHGHRPTPKDCKGEKCIHDHWCALECGGIDSVSNIVLQPYSESKKKDRVERTSEGCKKYCTSENSTPTRQVFNCK